jgi:hypothetical protein
VNGTEYLILAYALGLGLLWGYAALLWRESRAVAVRERARSSATGEGGRDDAGGAP